MRHLLFAGAVALAMAAGNASAAVYNLTKVEIPSSYIVHLSGPGINKDVKMGDQLLTFAGFDPFLAYCLDPYHNAVVGVQNNQYQEDVFTSPEYGGFPISQTAVYEINGLLRLAEFQDSLNRDAIQGGIWVKQGITVTSTVLAVQAAINFWATSTYQVVGPLRTYESIPDVNGTQRQAYGVAPIPEPATWALMILGFGAAGGMLRYQRRHPALA